MGAYDAVILGAGISGLSAAWRLARENRRILVLEAGDAPGGKVRTLRREGYLLECGPNTFNIRSSHLLSMCEALGVQPVSASAASRNRFVYHDGRLQKVPAGPWECLTSGLLSPAGKARLLLEPLQKQGLDRDESVARFARRRFGQEVLDNLLGPFVSGLYGGDPELMSMRAVFPLLSRLERQHGSVLRGMAQSRKAAASDSSRHGHTLFSFQSGLSGLVDALAGALSPDALWLNTRADRLSYRDGLYHLELEDGSPIAARSVVVATPTHEAARVLEVLSPTASAMLRNIRYVPLNVVHFGVKKQDVRHPLEGFGFLVSRAERRRLLGCVWASSLFENRAPEDCHLLSCYVQGDPVLSEDRLRLETLQELRRFLNAPQLVPCFAGVIRHPQAMPQYHLSHLQVVDRLSGLLSEFPGLYLCGNYLQGVSLESSAESGIRAAMAASAILSEKPRPCFL